jgi:hypothetical protein
MPELGGSPPEYPNQALGFNGVTDANAGPVNQVSEPIQFNNGCTISSGANAPTVGGNVGDLWIRTNPAGDSSYFYRCTVAGGAGVATWAAITGA